MLLFLEFIDSKRELEELKDDFEFITKTSMSHHMNFKNKMLITVNRFSSKRGTSRDLNWLSEFCENRDIDFKYKMKELKAYLEGL